MTDFTVTDNEGYSKEQSLNPVHLIADNKGHLPPSALVPFCSYQKDNNMLGQKRPELSNLTMCDKFEPIILEGKLCYSLDIAQMEKMSSVAGKNGGLFLILDSNPYLQNFGDTQETDEPQPFEIYINTLGQYRAYEGGAYAMRTLKQMTATESFTHLPDSQKKCLVHNIVECQAKKFMDQVKDKCNCVPWALQINNNNKEKACGPEKRTCVAEQDAKDKKSCLVPCTGIYADVTEERFLQQLRRQKYSNSTHVKNHENELHSLTEEYRRYKRSYVKQLGFDPKEENLSRFICSQQTLSKLYICSPLAGGCTVRGGVHLLWHRNLRRVRERCEGDVGNNFVFMDDMISHA